MRCLPHAGHDLRPTEKFSSHKTVPKTRSTLATMESFCQATNPGKQRRIEPTIPGPLPATR